MQLTKEETMNITVEVNEDLSEIFADSPEIAVSATADVYSKDFAIDEVTWRGETYRLSDEERWKELGDVLIFAIIKEMQAKVTEKADWQSREAIVNLESGADRSDVLCSGGC